MNKMNKTKTILKTKTKKIIKRKLLSHEGNYCPETTVYGLVPSVPRHKGHTAPFIWMYCTIHLSQALWLHWNWTMTSHSMMSSKQIGHGPPSLSWAGYNGCGVGVGISISVLRLRGALWCSDLTVGGRASPDRLRSCCSNFWCWIRFARNSSLSCWLWLSCFYYGCF